MDEIYKLAIDRIAYICTKAIIEQLLEIGLLAQADRQMLLGRIGTFFAARCSGTLNGHMNGKYTALSNTSRAY